MKISITPKNITTEFNIDLIAVKYEASLMDVFNDEADLRLAEKDWRDGYCICNHPYYQAIKVAKNFALRDLPPSIRAEIRIRHEYE